MGRWVPVTERLPEINDNNWDDPVRICWFLRDPSRDHAERYVYSEEDRWRISGYGFSDDDGWYSRTVSWYDDKAVPM